MNRHHCNSNDNSSLSNSRSICPEDYYGGGWKQVVVGKKHGSLELRSDDHWPALASSANASTSAKPTVDVVTGAPTKTKKKKKRGVPIASNGSKAKKKKKDVDVISAPAGMNRAADNTMRAVKQRDQITYYFSPSKEATTTVTPKQKKAKQTTAKKSNNGNNIASYFLPKQKQATASDQSNHLDSKPPAVTPSPKEAKKKQPIPTNDSKPSDDDTNGKLPAINKKDPPPAGPQDEVIDFSMDSEDEDTNGNLDQKPPPINKKKRKKNNQTRGIKKKRNCFKQCRPRGPQEPLPVEQALDNAEDEQQSPVQLWPEEPLPREQALRNAERFILEANKACTKDELEKIETLHKIIVNKISDLYDNPEHPFLQRSCRPINSKTGAGVYFGVHRNGTTKFGCALNLEERTNEQENLNSVVLVMTTDEIFEKLGTDWIESITKIGLPSLHGHEDQRDTIEKLVARYVGEGILGCMYANDCDIYFEKLTRMPSSDDRIGKVVNMRRFNLCLAVANGDMTIDQVEKLDSKLGRAIRFIPSLPIGETIQFLFSWTTLKSENYTKFGKTAFMKAQRTRPEYQFLKCFMAASRCGDFFRNNDWTDALDESPCVTVVIKKCLKELLPFLEKEVIKLNQAIRTGNKYVMDDSIRDQILQEMKAIQYTNGFEQYMHPKDEVLGAGSKKELEKEFLSKESSTVMLQTQNSNVTAIKSSPSGQQWWNKNFQEEFKLSHSTFYKTRGNNNKLLVSTAAHYLIFSHDVRNTQRLNCIDDYCLHLCLMMANGMLDSEHVQKWHRTFECYLIHLLFDKKAEDTDRSFRFARNLVFPKEWFKAALPGIKATSNLLQIHEQVLMYLYNKTNDNKLNNESKCGNKLMKVLLFAFGAMVNNLPEQLAPYEPGATCPGMPEYTISSGKKVKARPCVHCTKGGKAADRFGNLQYGGAKGGFVLGHRLHLYLACVECFRTNSRRINYLYLEENNRAELTKKRKRNGKNQAAFKKANPEKAAENEIIQNQKRKLDPEKRAARNNYQKRRYQQKKNDGSVKTQSGRTNRGDTKDSEFRYDGELRKKMKQAIYLLTLTGRETFSNKTAVVKLLDEIRKQHGDPDPNYYAIEYGRCILAFLKPKEEDGSGIENNKLWVPAIELKKKGAPFIRNSAKDTEVVAQVAKACFDHKQFVREKEYADSIAFAKLTQEEAKFSVEGTRKTVKEWFQAAQKVRELDEKYGAWWRWGNQNIPAKTIVHLNKLRKGLDRIRDNEQRGSAEELISGELQTAFEQKHNSSLRNFVENYYKFQKNYYKKDRI